MRYTTIVDISEFPTIYRNVNARLVYLHLCLKSGYHDNDRDLVALSLRRIAAEVGLTLSATRHAIGQLEKAQLLTRQGPIWYVKKFVLEKSITPRVRSEKKQKEVEIKERERIIKEEQEQREREEIRKVKEMKRAGKNPLFEMVKDLMKKAANGDLEAAESLTRYKPIVNQIKAQMQ